VAEINITPIDFADLGRYRLGRSLQHARSLDRATGSYRIEPEKLAEGWQAFCQRHQLDPENPERVPREFFGCPARELRSAVERDLRIDQWKNETFGPQARERFYVRKPALDRVVYSVLRVSDPGVARELWFRLSEREATFAELAPRYAAGNEVYTAGIVGPLQFGVMHPEIANVLRSAAPGELLKPFAIGEWHLVARVDHHLPTEFDDAVRAQMIEELLHVWLEESEKND
jgi:hypothetical protein